MSCDLCRQTTKKKKEKERAQTNNGDKSESAFNLMCGRSGARRMLNHAKGFNTQT
jgi:hypothetical protein